MKLLIIPIANSVEEILNWLKTGITPSLLSNQGLFHRNLRFLNAVIRGLVAPHHLEAFSRDEMVSPFEKSIPMTLLIYLYEQ